MYPIHDIDQIKVATARAVYVILLCGSGNITTLPRGTANYYRYLAQWSNSDTTLACVTTVGIQTN